MPAANVLGISSVNVALLQSFDQEKRFSDTPPVLESDGKFNTAEAYGEEWEMTFKGWGDVPVAIQTLGGAIDQGATALTGYAGGVTIISSIEQSDFNTKHNEFSVVLMGFPNAT